MPVTSDPLLALPYISDGWLSARWNFPDAVGTPLSAPGGIGNAAVVSYSFPTSAPSYFSTTGFAPFSAVQKQAARDVLASISSVCRLTFVEVIGTGDITLAMNSQSGNGGFAYAPTYQYSTTSGTITSASPIDVAGDVWLSNTWTSGDFGLGGSGYGTLLHELGHAIGLKHPFDGINTLDPSLDNKAFTVMSYAPAPNSLFRTVTYTGPYSWSASYATIQPETLMPLDILALQYLYGANTTANAGDNVYTFDPGRPFFKTLWDGGGQDTISVANFSLGSIIDLRAGHYSSVRILTDPLPPGYVETNPGIYDGSNNLAIAYGVIIENAVGGTGNDQLIGNAANNRLTGGGGNDTLDGGQGMDTAVYAGMRSGYTVTRGAGFVTVTDIFLANGSEGTDTLTGIERLQFSDALINLAGQPKDFGGDGKSDILWRSVNTGALYAYQMNGAVIANAGFVIPSGPSGWQVLESRANFGGDGKSDILWWNASTKSAFLYEMNGTAIQNAGFIRENIPAGWDIVGTRGDYNGDGKADLLWKNTENATYIFLMNGTTIIGEGYERTGIGAGWQILEASADYNADGKSDILWQNTVSGALYIDHVSGTGIASEGYVIASGPAGWSVIGAKADLNGDGKSDILWHHAASNSVYAYLMNGTTIQDAGFITQNVPAGWDIVETRGDYNGDGKADILWKNAENATYIFLMDGTAIIGEGYERTGIGAGWQIADAQGDYNGDGKSDILWKNAVSGDVYLDLINGTSIQSEGYVAYGVPAEWGILG